MVVDPCELEGEGDCAGAGSDECGTDEEDGTSFFAGKDEEVWVWVWTAAILAAEPEVVDALGKVLDAFRALDGCVLVVFSKMSFFAPSWKLYKSR